MDNPVAGLVACLPDSPDGFTGAAKTHRY